MVCAFLHTKEGVLPIVRGWRIRIGNLKASRPLVGFGVSIDNTIKGLICLHENMRRNSIKKLMLNEMA